jgi:hypothetical protein
MKKGMIFRTILHVLSTYFIAFGIGILSAYLWGDGVNVPEELISAAIFCVVYFGITYFLQQKKKSENADNDSGDTQ